MIGLEQDGLERKEFINDLFDIFDNFGNYDDGGLTLSINGRYGSGKSTLLNFIEEKNKQDNKYNIIKYDAWTNNLFENPLIPILYSLNKLETTKSKIVTGAKNIIKNLPKVFTNTLSNTHCVDFSPLLSNENIFSEYKAYEESIVKYKKILSEFCKKKKTILLIDELDRCLPEYQIKVLEILYNVFNIPELILVIAIDKSQIEHTIKKIFGNQENVSNYLSKFIQYEMDLPENKNNKYLQSLVLFNCKHKEVKTICANMFNLAKVSIRNSLQIVKELNLVCNEKNQNGESIQYSYWYPLFVCFILIIKKQYREIYQKYFYNNIEPDEIVNEQIAINKTLYFDFLQDVKGTNIENIINNFINKKMNFAVILYYINYFHFIRNIDLNSLSKYTNIETERIQSIINGYEIPMWRRYEYNETLRKIRSFKK